MNVPSSGNTVAGICYARAGNAGLPPASLIYITVADLDESLRQCEANGGKLLAPVRTMPEGRYAVIQDPAGAAAALFQQT